MLLLEINNKRLGRRAPGPPHSALPPFAPFAMGDRGVSRRADLPLGGRHAGRAVRMLRSHAKTDRGSVFVAHLAFPIASDAVARSAIAALKRDVGDVDHAMSAYRVPAAAPADPASGPRTTNNKRPRPAKPKVASGFDDDGEARGGAAIRAELNARRALGVAVVVTRSYGGVNLGKARFEHIRDRVRILLDAAGCEPDVPASSDAFRGAGRRLDGADGGVAAALGGVPIGVAAETFPASIVPATVPPSRLGGAAGNPKRSKKKTKPPIPAAVASDIRARLLAAAEKRRASAGLVLPAAAALSAGGAGTGTGAGDSGGRAASTSGNEAEPPGGGAAPVPGGAAVKKETNYRNPPAETTAAGIAAPDDVVNLADEDE